MSIFRSYYSKNTTLISGNSTNNSQNPVTEISYGTLERQVTRLIFDVDLSDLENKILQGIINSSRIVKHILHMTNTISYAPQYIGRKSYSSDIQRASSFDLDLFNIEEPWDEGSGYDFIYNNTLVAYPVIQASNWYSASTITSWHTAGAYTGSSQIISTQHFDEGNENIEIDITDYINERLTGNSTSYGLGLKFQDYYEALETIDRQAVAFHTKNTNTWYEPYIETIIDDTIVDDRNYFYLNKDNDLYLYVKVGGIQQNITVNSVNIYDYNGNLYTTLDGSSIINIGKGIYKITLNIDSNDYPDGVLFSDEWKLNINGKDVTYNNDFYLISSENYYTFDNPNGINFNNYYFYFWGIQERENLRAGDVRKIKLTIKEMYANQNNFLPLEIEYRLFTTLGKDYEINVIPFTVVNRTNSGYEFNLDTSWLIPQDYYLQIRMKDGSYYENKKTLSFTVVSDGSKLFNK